MSEHFGTVRAWIADLSALRHYRVEMRELRHRVLGANGDGGAMGVKDRLGKALLLAAASADGGSMILRQRETGRPAFVASATGAGGGMQVFGAEGMRIFDVISGDDGGTLRIADEQGNLGVVL